MNPKDIKSIMAANERLMREVAQLRGEVKRYRQQNDRLMRVVRKQEHAIHLASSPTVTKTGRKYTPNVAARHAGISIPAGMTIRSRTVSVQAIKLRVKTWEARRDAKEGIREVVGDGADKLIQHASYTQLNKIVGEVGSTVYKTIGSDPALHAWFEMGGIDAENAVEEATRRVLTRTYKKDARLPNWLS